MNSPLIATCDIHESQMVGAESGSKLDSCRKRACSSDGDEVNLTKKKHKEFFFQTVLTRVS